MGYSPWVCKESGTTERLSKVSFLQNRNHVTFFLSFFKFSQAYPLVSLFLFLFFFLFCCTLKHVDS